jgi:hypothetical protein
MPEELKNYVNDYAKAKTEGKSDEFVVKQATTAYANALKGMYFIIKLHAYKVLQNYFVFFTDRKCRLLFKPSNQNM